MVKLGSSFLGAMLVLSGTSALAQSQVLSQAEALQASDRAMLESEVPGIHFLAQGHRISRIYGAAFAQGESPIGSAEGFLAAHPNIFAGGDCTYQLTGAQDVMNGKFTAVYFQQVIGDVPVDQSNITFLVRMEKGFPVVLAVNGTETVSACATKPLMTADMAIQAALSQNKRLGLVTKPQLVIHVGETENRLAWSFEAESPSLSNPEKFTVFTDAITGEILEWRNLICELDVSGSLQGYATPGFYPDWPSNPAILTNLYGGKVTIAGVSTSYSDANGNFTLTNPGTDPVNVVSTLEGRWVRVIDNTTPPALSFTQSVTPPGPVAFLYNPTPETLKTSQVNGLIQTTAVHDYIRSISATYPGIDVQLPCNVNVAGSGNAFYNGSSINFYNAGGVYPNMCYSTIVWHEYGHHVVQSAGTAQNGYGEGMADVCANLFANSNLVGLDFYGAGMGALRDAYNTVTYPSSAEIHTQGMILSGAFWLTYQSLASAYGSATGMSVIRNLWLNSILLRPAGISPAITTDVLTLDDNDANILNGTPHASQISYGFNAKNLTGPAYTYVLVDPVSLPEGLVKPPTTSPSSTDMVTFVVKVRPSMDIVNPNGVLLKVGYGTGAYSTVTMKPIGGDNYQASIRTPRRGQGVRYYVEVTSAQGNVTTGPDSSALTPKSFIVGSSVRQMTSDTFDTDKGWTVTNTAITGGAWVRMDPNGSYLTGVPCNPENDSDDAGSFCWFTGQGNVGGGAGTADVDGGPTIITSPTFSMAGGNGMIEYSRWFYNDDGDDSINVEMSNNNGLTWTTVDKSLNTPTSNTWIRRTVVVGNFLTPTSQMKVRVSTSDNPNNSVTEAAFDNFVVKMVQ